MNNSLKMTLFWVLTVIITISAAIYQRKTGPTHPKKLKFSVGSANYKVNLIRSHSGTSDCPLVFEIADKDVSAKVALKRYPTNDEWRTMDLIREGDLLKGTLPLQPPAGKIEYKVSFFKGDKLLNNPEDSHVIIRFKGAVPNGILIPHILLMFFAMLMSNLAGILAIGKHKRMVFYANLTLVLLIVGGVIFGPIMQLYAFGELWTGFPNGKDFTDNKTLFALIFWIIAVVVNRKKQRPVWIIIAAIVMLAVYMIPHSMGGSELNYESGTVITG